MDKRDKIISSNFRVGLVSFLAFVLLAAGIMFTGGDKGLLFKKTDCIEALLYDVGGLKRGCSVTMGGMTIGKVSDIQFADNSVEKLIKVTMQVRQDIHPRIKTDSIPTIRTQGMLGDRYIDVSMGSDKADSLPPGKPLVGKSTTDFDDALQQATNVMKESEKLLVAINEQKGTVGSMVYSKDVHNRLIEIADELKNILQDFKKQPRRYLKFSVF